MSGQLSWTREGETLALHGELDQDLLVPLWEARAQATAGTAIIDLSQTTRVDTAGLALLVHFVALIRRQGREAQLVGKSENLQTLIGLYNLPADLILIIFFSALALKLFRKPWQSFRRGFLLV